VPVLEHVGVHPTGDPLGFAVVLANICASTDGVRAGQFVTCGSCTGLRYLSAQAMAAACASRARAADVTFTR